MNCILMKIVLVLVCVCVACDAQNACKTPDNGNGKCVFVAECPYISQLLKTKPLTRPIIQQVQKYQCGSVNKKPKVCCPDDSGSSIPDVSAHRNVKLINGENCGVSDVSNRIINGNITGIFEFPWMALLSYRTGSRINFQCGGSLINDLYILTAAHCVANLGRKTLVGIRLGEHNIATKVDCEMVVDTKVCAPKVQDFPIQEVIVHPQYERTSKAIPNDIALIRLARKVTFDENVVPICLPINAQESNSIDFASSVLVVTGWGVTETGLKSDALLKVNVPYMTTDACKKFYTNQIEISNRQLCAGGGQNRADSCSGDSGGPLQIFSRNADARYYQYGLVSFGARNCGTVGQPAVYSRITHYMDWILDNIKP